MKKTRFLLFPNLQTTHKRLCGPALVVFFLILSAPFAFGGMVIKEKNEVRGDPSSSAKLSGETKSREATTYLQGKKARIETEKQVVIIDFDKSRFLKLDPLNKTFTDVSLEEMKEAQKRTLKWLANLRKNMEEKLKALPPEKQESMREKMEAIPLLEPEDESREIRFEVKSTGKRKKINGFECMEYEVYENGEKATIYWLTTSVPYKEFDAYQQEKRMWLKGSNPALLYRLNEWEHIREKGFPIKAIRIKPVMGKATFIQEVFQVENKKLAESLFQPPAEFKAKKTPPIPDPDHPKGKPSKPAFTPGKN